MNKQTKSGDKTIRTKSLIYILMVLLSVYLTRGIYQWICSYFWPHRSSAIYYIVLVNFLYQLSDYWWQFVLDGHIGYLRISNSLIKFWIWSKCFFCCVFPQNINTFVKEKLTRFLFILKKKNIFILQKWYTINIYINIFPNAPTNGTLVDRRLVCLLLIQNSWKKRKMVYSTFYCLW